MALSTLAGYSLASRVSPVGTTEIPPQAGRFCLKRGTRFEQREGRIKTRSGSAKRQGAGPPAPTSEANEHTDERKNHLFASLLTTSESV